MKKCEVVKNNRDFERIIQKGQLVKNKEFVVYYASNDLNFNRFGISVGKKIGNAVNRNYYKRITRNICDIHKKNYSKYKDYIIILRCGCLNGNYNYLEESLGYLMNKINKEKENENEKEN